MLEFSGKIYVALLVLRLFLVFFVVLRLFITVLVYLYLHALILALFASIFCMICILFHVCCVESSKCDFCIV